MRFRASTLVLASVEEQWDRDVISCDKHVTKAANDSNGVVRDVFSFMLMLFWRRYQRSCRRCLADKRISIERERRLAARRQEDETRLKEQEIRRKRRRRCAHTHVFVS